jgi:hypothetical protein
VQIQQDRAPRRTSKSSQDGGPADLQKGPSRRLSEGREKVRLVNRDPARTPNIHLGNVRGDLVRAD